MEKSKQAHPYLQGNFAPIHHGCGLTPCDYTGSIPMELAGGQYVRNGSNPFSNEELSREAHWFDGDGMLCGVYFQRARNGSILPEFVSQYILTDTYLAAATTPSLHSPILPSIATLVNPASTLWLIIRRIIRTVLIILLSHVSGSQQVISRISVANTNILYHDGRALATCESGPPIRVSLPRLETVGWYDGRRVEGEPAMESVKNGDSFGGKGYFELIKERTTAHPRVDPETKELILFHSSFLSPFLFYSIIPIHTPNLPQNESYRLIHAPIPGIKSAKMMHDMGVSRNHCVVLDLPLSLDPFNLMRNKPVVSFNTCGSSRFGVFPRRNPNAIRWFETVPCCIFHTANTWDEVCVDPKEFNGSSHIRAVNMLVCRLTSASLIFNAGNITDPISDARQQAGNIQEEDQCRLYYFRFSLGSNQNIITHQFALSAIPFEFPSVRDKLSMSETRYIYGCSSSRGNFGSALEGAVKIDCLVKINALKLIDQGKVSNIVPITGCVDERTVSEIAQSTDTNEPIKIFQLAPGYYAQEPRFVARQNGKYEDDGWLLSYIFDESQLDADGSARPDAHSELWIINAQNMREVVCKIALPLRVPYGLHGNWFSEKSIENQRLVEEIRYLRSWKGYEADGWSMGEKLRRKILNLIG